MSKKTRTKVPVQPISDDAMELLAGRFELIAAQLPKDVMLPARFTAQLFAVTLRALGHRIPPRSLSKIRRDLARLEHALATKVVR